MQVSFMKTFFFLLPFLLLSGPSRGQSQPVRADVCVYGGTSAGVMAAYTAKKMGKTVLLIEPGRTHRGRPWLHRHWQQVRHHGAVP